MNHAGHAIDMCSQGFPKWQQVFTWFYFYYNAWIVQIK